MVLDVDGTLMDTNYLHVEAWADALKSVGVHPVRAEIHRQIGKGSDKLVPQFVEDEELFERVNELHSDNYARLWESANPLPGAVEIIEDLDERGYGVWLATSAKPDELEVYLEQLKAEGRISGIVNSSDVEESKPASDIFELALKKASVKASEAVALGDTVWDVEAAKGAGISTVGVLTGGAFSEAELRESGAVEVCRVCTELLESSFRSKSFTRSESRLSRRMVHGIS